MDLERLAEECFNALERAFHAGFHAIEPDPNGASLTLSVQPEILGMPHGPIAE
jgi:hypothetical protein